MPGEMGDIEGDASHSSLQEALQTGRQTSHRWAERIDPARRQTGNGALSESAAHENPILEAHFAVSRRVREQAPDDTSRDLGTVADRPFALHRWIAASGTMARTTGELGLEHVARQTEQSPDEVEEADEQHPALADQRFHAA